MDDTRRHCLSLVVAHMQSSQGDDTKYYDVKDRQRSPPRYERAVLERLHEVSTPLLMGP